MNPRYETQYDGEHLKIRRIDGLEARCSWTMIQEIKNEIVGPDVEMVEVYPAAGSVADETNTRHLWRTTGQARFGRGRA